MKRDLEKTKALINQVVEDLSCKNAQLLGANADLEKQKLQYNEKVENLAIHVNSLEETLVEEKKRASFLQTDFTSKLDQMRKENMKLLVELDNIGKRDHTDSTLLLSALTVIWQLTSHAELTEETLSCSGMKFPGVIWQILCQSSDLKQIQNVNLDMLLSTLGILTNISTVSAGRLVLTNIEYFEKGVSMVDKLLLVGQCHAKNEEIVGMVLDIISNMAFDDSVTRFLLNRDVSWRFQKKISLEKNARFNKSKRQNEKVFQFVAALIRETTKESIRNYAIDLVSCRFIPNFGSSNRYNLLKHQLYELFEFLKIQEKDGNMRNKKSVLAVLSREYLKHCEE